MPNIKRLDPGASPLHYFGSELRRLREAAGLTLEQLGDIVYLTGSMIGQVETAARIPKQEHIPRLDTALGADGALLRAWEPAKRSRLPYKLQRISEIEAEAQEIAAFQPQLVHGLLQTGEYARAVLGVIHQENLDGRVNARLERQRILSWDEPPLYWVVLGENVLFQEVGGPAVMWEQLKRLLDFQQRKHVQIQVLPFEVGVHAGMGGAFTLYTYTDQPRVAYAENYTEVDATANPPDVRERSLRYDLLRAAALSPRDSTELIANVMEDRYAGRAESQ